MADFFEQKKHNQRQFREYIDKYLKQFAPLQFQNQFNQATLQMLLSNTKDDIMQNGKVNLDNLFQIMKKQNTSHPLSLSDFQSIFGLQKFLKLSDLVLILKKYNLHTIDIKSQILPLFFEQFQLPSASHSSSLSSSCYRGKQKQREGEKQKQKVRQKINKFKFAKYDKITKQLNYPQLNPKNKEIVIDCFDFNENGYIDDSDVDQFLEIICGKQIRQREKERERERETGNQQEDKEIFGKLDKIDIGKINQR